MAYALSARGLRPLSESSSAPFLARITTNTKIDSPCGDQLIFRAIASTDKLPPGYRGYLLDKENIGPFFPDSYLLPRELEYLSEGDVVRVDPLKGRVTTLFRCSDCSTGFLVTEQCNNHCIMCSQPPREGEDPWLADEFMQVIPLLPADTQEVGITGGEPSLLGHKLVEMTRALKEKVPDALVQILTNGRGFADPKLARALANVGHPRLLLCVPLYSDLPEDHDYVAQSKGAFDQAVRGILNLKRNALALELRIILQAPTLQRLPELASFITRNLVFVDHVALMGMEITGHVKTNIEHLWVDPTDYQDELEEAVSTLVRAGIHTSIYNHPLCVLRPALRDYARKSISAWKNIFLKECDSCEEKDVCGGFFSSSTIRLSRGVAPLKTPGL